MDHQTKQTIDYSLFTLSELLGRKIRHIRKNMHLSQEEFAWKIDVHRTYLGQIERAEKNISIRNIQKICEALAIDPKDLFDFSDVL